MKEGASAMTNAISALSTSSRASSAMSSEACSALMYATRGGGAEALEPCDSRKARIVATSAYRMWRSCALGQTSEGTSAPLEPNAAASSV